jgi:quercetin dioxygenase-like cupin family protein
MTDERKIDAKRLRKELAEMTASELYTQREFILGQVTLLEEEVAKRSQEGKRLVPASDPQWREDPTTGVKIWTIVAPEEGFTMQNFYMFMLWVPPGYKQGKYHVHGDAVKHYISGHGVEIIADQRYEVGPGDFIHIPAGIWHGTENASNEEPVIILAAQIRPGAPNYVPVSHLSQGVLLEEEEH